MSEHHDRGRHAPDTQNAGDRDAPAADEWPEEPPDCSACGKAAFESMEEMGTLEERQSLTDGGVGEYESVAAVEDLRPGEGLGVEVNGIEMALFNVEGDYYAIANRCGHQRAPLCKTGHQKLNGDKCYSPTLGLIDGETPSVHCPWHLWEWNLKSGENPVTGMRISTFDVRVEDGEVQVRI